MPTWTQVAAGWTRVGLVGHGDICLVTWTVRVFNSNEKKYNQKIMRTEYTLWTNKNWMMRVCSYINNFISFWSHTHAFSNELSQCPSIGRHRKSMLRGMPDTNHRNIRYVLGINITHNITKSEMFSLSSYGPFKNIVR